MMKTLAGQSFQPLTELLPRRVLHHPRYRRRRHRDLPADRRLHQRRGEPEGEVLRPSSTRSTRMRAAVPQQYTPLRGALSKAGRYYAGKFFTGGRRDCRRQARDPMQYSCQQNFTLLASDGYWNSSDDTDQLRPIPTRQRAPRSATRTAAARPCPCTTSLGKSEHAGRRRHVLLRDRSAQPTYPPTTPALRARPARTSVPLTAPGRMRPTSPPPRSTTTSSRT